MTGHVLSLQPPWLDAQRPRLGRYVLGPLLGKGGMGEVVEAWDVVLCRTVALKLLRNMEPTAVIRFMHEAQVQARVAHPAICRVFDVDATDGTVKIAMQLVRGATLEQAGPELPISEKIRIMAQVAEGVHAAHRLKLIHRDLKPSNILLEHGEDGGLSPCICDFGLAMALDEPALTGSNAVIGTPAYMAPEQFRGDRAQIGPATDVYCLGGTLHYLLTGRAPGSAETTRSRRRRPEEDSGVTRASLPRGLRSILARCLQADPSLRYPSAAALAEDLWAFHNGQEVRASLPGPLEKAWRRVRPRLKTAFPAALALGGVLVGSLATQGILAWSASREARVAGPFRDPFRDLERSLIMARARPLHDLRPERSMIEERLEALKEEMGRQGGAAQAPGHAAMAWGRLLLRDFQGARAEAERALALGSRDPELPRVLARALAGLALADLAAGPPPASPFLPAPPPTLPGPGRAFDRAVASFLRQDWTAAAAEARTATQMDPWCGMASALEVASLSRLAQGDLEAGDLGGAEARYREALAAAQAFLPRAPSDGWAHHAEFLAARGLAAEERLDGSLPGGFLADQLARCDEVLRANPTSPELQDDWLAFHLLEALREMDLGQDPQRILDDAMIFQGTRTKEPLTRALKTDRMALHWLLARRDFDHGADPFPALAEALKIQGELPIPFPNLRSRVLALEAQAKAARQEDPRPVLTEALAPLEARLAKRSAWDTALAAAGIWLQRAQWEAAHHESALGSAAKAEALAASAFQANPRSAEAYAVTGLALAVEGWQLPTQRDRLRKMAWDHLRTSERLGPCSQARALHEALGAP